MYRYNNQEFVAASARVRLRGIRRCITAFSHELEYCGSQLAIIIEQWNARDLGEHITFQQQQEQWRLLKRAHEILETMKNLEQEHRAIIEVYPDMANAIPVVDVEDSRGQRTEEERSRESDETQESS